MDGRKSAVGIGDLSACWLSRTCALEYKKDFSTWCLRHNWETAERGEDFRICHKWSEVAAMSAEFGLTHFIGIGGAGMSAIATVLLQSGCPVSGSDLNDSPVVSRLREMGAQILIGHNASNLPANAERVVFSTAISLENSEVQAAKQRGIPIIHRADMLSKMMNKQKGIAISGAHGKTTTSAMIGMILLENGLDPTVVVGVCYGV